MRSQFRVTDHTAAEKIILTVFVAASCVFAGYIVRPRVVEWQSTSENNQRALERALTCETVSGSVREGQPFPQFPKGKYVCGSDGTTVKVDDLNLGSYPRNGRADLVNAAIRNRVPE